MVEMTAQIVIAAFIIFASSVEGYEPATQWCYRCVSNQPGCGENFNWLWWWSQACPEKGDKCVKLIERKGGDVVITRDCLSVIRTGFRTDIPADLFEGCRIASRDPHLGNYVNNTMKELDVYRNFYDSVEYCICFFKNRCNGSSFIALSPFLMAATLGVWHLLS